MRQRALFKHFRAEGAELLAYRIQILTMPNRLQIPPGGYMVVRMRVREHDMRILLGPLELAEAEHLLTTAGPEDLVDLLQRSTETPSPHDTLH